MKLTLRVLISICALCCSSYAYAQDQEVAVIAERAKRREANLTLASANNLFL